MEHLALCDVLDESCEVLVVSEISIAFQAPGKLIDEGTFGTHAIVEMTRQQIVEECRATSRGPEQEQDLILVRECWSHVTPSHELPNARAAGKYFIVLPMAPGGVPRGILSVVDVRDDQALVDR
jgi:hypothetical protein